jgi:type I restriction enzyme M protein
MKNYKCYIKNYYLAQKQPYCFYNKNTKKEIRNNQSTEVLFIEQCYNYLKEGGYLAVVIPDGILTNSSLQYVRDAIEDWYRIVPVVSMPQTAFSATGAGVKSSVLFLKKYTRAQTQKLKDLKIQIQNSIKTEFGYVNKIEAWDKEKKEIIKDLKGFANSSGLVSVNAIKDSDEFKEWRTEINQKYADLLSELQEEMQERCREEKAKRLPDYPILMAIAENIGYDATGKNSAKLISRNEVIEGNYRKIIEHISHDLYDEEIIKKYGLHDDKEEISTKKTVKHEGILKELSKFIKAVDNGRI